MNDPAPDRDMANIWSALRRRKVVQWGLVYVAAAWGFLQGLEYVSEAFHWPQQVRQIALLALADRPAHRPGPRLVPRRPRSAAHQHPRVRDPHAAPAARRRGVLVLPARQRDGYGCDATVTDRSATATDRSIAVLPFVNMSARQGAGVLRRWHLGGDAQSPWRKLPGLRVIGRTSSFSFKGKREDMRADRSRLNVANMLEGSVRKSGKQVRISAQLIKVEDGYNLWSESYDRKLTDIFAVQDEIAGAVLAALKPNVVAEAQKVTATTGDMEAYLRYLKGASLLAKRGEANLRGAIAEFESALSVDPNYVPAHVGLARTLALLPLYMGGRGASAGHPKCTRVRSQALVVR